MDQFRDQVFILRLESVLLFVGMSPCGDLISRVVKSIEDISNCFHVANYFQNEIVEANQLSVDSAENTQSDAAFKEHTHRPIPRHYFTWRPT